MSDKKNHKRWRVEFREAVFARDKDKCVFCSITEGLNAHHITDRHEMPNGGYVLNNGITVCPKHHLDAEQFHIDGIGIDGFLPDDLYNKIGSSFEQAFSDSCNLR